MNDQIELITPDSAQDLVLLLGSSFDLPTLQHHLTIFPGVSWMLRYTDEHLIGGYWRGRKEIGMIVETVAQTNRLALVQQAVEHFRAMNCSAVTLSHYEADNNYEFYSKLGWKHFDEITTYERLGCSVAETPPSQLEIRPFMVSDLPALLDLEVSAFPWLWLSDYDDFIRYANSYGVRVFTAWIGEEMVGYLGLTLISFRGHLDRIAVHQKYQNKGFGEELLVFALSWLSKHHARRINLNTQISNYRSQALYRKYGFRLTGENHAVLGLRLRNSAEQHFGDSLAI